MARRNASLAMALAGAGVLTMAPTFVPALTGTAQVAPALRGAASSASAAESTSMGPLVGAAVLLAAGGVARSSRVARRAEPISAAAAAAAGAAAAKAATAAAGAKAAVGAAGAAKAGAAVAGGKAAVGSTAVGAGTGQSLSSKEGGPSNPKFNPADQVGVTAPLGFFDPAGFCKPGDEAGFRNLRAAEIKHGRVAMMAALGAVVQHYVKLPGFESVPAGLDAVSATPGTYGFAALFAVSGLLELGAWTEDPSKEPGNFGDPANFGQYTIEMRNRELNNGRMAMFAALGIIAADLLTGKDGIEQFGLA